MLGWRIKEEIYDLVNHLRHVPQPQENNASEKEGKTPRRKEMVLGERWTTRTKLRIRKCELRNRIMTLRCATDCSSKVIEAKDEAIHCTTRACAAHPDLKYEMSPDLCDSLQSTWLSLSACHAVAPLLRERKQKSQYEPLTWVSLMLIWLCNWRAAR